MINNHQRHSGSLTRLSNEGLRQTIISNAVYEVVEEMTDSEDYTDKTSRVWQDALGRDIRFVYNDDDDVAVNYTKKMNPINWVYQVVDMK
jgi:hypothetical protein